MSLDDKFVPFRTAIYNASSNFFHKIAGFFGYPENPGMPIMDDRSDEIYLRREFFARLPKHVTYWPPAQRPETWFEMVFGPTPKIETVPRYIYESKEEGFYNFYIENYKNLILLPDWLSEFIQVRLNICLDISVLEAIREVLFIGLVVYTQLIVLRIAVGWLIYINPYTVPWSYLLALIDWSEDFFQGIVPSILGVNITATIFLGVVGAIGDSLNHLIFTMPFLPSEGEETKVLLDQEIRDVLVFHYLPVTWYRYPIPNDIRKYWYYERPDILEYMQKAYKDLDIKFLPDNVIQELNQKGELLTSNDLNISSYSSTEILSNGHLFSSNVITSYLSDHFHNFFHVF